VALKWIITSTLTRLLPSMPREKNTMRSHVWFIAIISAFFAYCSGHAQAQNSAMSAKASEKIIIDTDIGDDIDDAFAVALALRSPELNVLGISTTYGPVEAKAKILDRMLGEVGRQDIPVAVGIANIADPAVIASLSSQQRYGAGGHFARESHPLAVDFILEQIGRSPGEITLVAIGPLTNIGALIDKSPETFRKLKRVVILAGAIAPLKPEYGSAPIMEPAPEWNIKGDISASKKLFRSGVPIFLMTLDSTFNLKLDEVKRNILFAEGTSLTDALTLLYHQWSAVWGVTPVLCDAMAIAYILDPRLCPVQPMRIRVDDNGATRIESGTPNAQVCLRSDADGFLRFYMSRLLAQ
jgi:purine nucleosidase